MTSTIRVSGGSMRGRLVPVIADGPRPTLSRARQAYFNIIGTRIVDAVFLDLFAGTGIFAIEAVSRGASRAIAVESSRPAAETLRATVAKLQIPVEVKQLDAMQALRHGFGTIDLVYADPPYGWTDHAALLDALDAISLAHDAVVAIEHRAGPAGWRENPLMNLAYRKTAEYGTVAISIFDKVEGKDNHDADAQ